MATMGLGRRLRGLREARGMTQSEVGRRLGVKPNFISMVEAEQARVPPERAPDLARLFGLPAWPMLRAALVEQHPGLDGHLPPP